MQRRGDLAPEGRGVERDEERLRGVFLQVDLEVAVKWVG